MVTSGHSPSGNGPSGIERAEYSARPKFTCFCRSAISPAGSSNKKSRSAFQREAPPKSSFMLPLWSTIRITVGITRVARTVVFAHAGSPIAVPPPSRSVPWLPPVPPFGTRPPAIAGPGLIGSALPPSHWPLRLHVALPEHAPFLPLAAAAMQSFAHCPLAVQYRPPAHGSDLLQEVPQSASPSTHGAASESSPPRLLQAPSAMHATTTHAPFLIRHLPAREQQPG